jgi:hypothetical protein
MMALKIDHAVWKYSTLVQLNRNVGIPTTESKSSKLEATITSVVALNRVPISALNAMSVQDMIKDIKDDTAPSREAVHALPASLEAANIDGAMHKQMIIATMPVVS